MRVEWKAPPAAVTASEGRDRCGMARAADVAPTSTWGIPDVAVWLDVTGPVPPPARVVISPCAIAPRVQVARGTFAIASAVEGPSTATVVHHGDPRAAGSGAARTPVQLPAIGHAVEVALEPAPAADEIDASETDAWVIAVDGAGGVTDAGGQVVLRDVPTGAHAVTAYLPPHGAASARVAHGHVDVLPGGLAEVTLDLGSGSGAP